MASLARLVVVALIFLPSPLRAAEPPKLDGTWLFDVAQAGKQDALPRFWVSVVTIKDGQFSLTKLMDHKKDLKGKLVFDKSDPRAVNLSIEELDFAELGMPVKIPACTIPGIFQAEANRLTICFASKPEGKRPTEFKTSETAYLVTFTRAPVGFKDFPKELAVRVLGPDSKPVAGATVAQFASKHPGKDGKADWTYYKGVKTGADGVAKVPFDEPPLVVHDAQANLVAFPTSSPAQLAGGELRVTLGPECRVTGKITSQELTKAGGKVEWTNVYLIQDGRRMAACSSIKGEFEFLAPPGKYTLNAYGEEMPSKDVTITVPPNQSEYTVEPIDLKASALALLKGKPAPELEGVIGWSGKPVKFADLKGQYVLVDFWGYWCGPCVGAMPVLIELHEKFGGKGLTIIGVHVDLDGEVDTDAKLQEKVAQYVKGDWKKPLPFSNVLVSGSRDDEGVRKALPPKQYGIQGYPTTILIDPEGKVVGKFHARDIKTATAEMEKLLAGKK